MHELSIAQSIIESARAEMAGREPARVVRIGLRVGDISGVQPDALKFSFDVIVRDTEFEAAELDIERVPLRLRCRGCDNEYDVAGFGTPCPSCGGDEGSPVGGDELQLTYLELE